MRRHAFLLLLSVAGTIPVYGFELMQEGYSLQSYAQYASPTSSGRMVFDDSENLYMGHFDDGKIIKIDSQGQTSTLVSGLSPIYDLTWGGGTAYGNFLYASSHAGTYPDKIYQIDTNGNASYFPMKTPNHGSCGIGIDRTGNYNNQLYVGTGSIDRIVSVSTTGSVSTFSTWPGQYGGGVYGLSFDPSGKYNHKMFLANIYDDASISGLFVMNPNGTVSRFADDFVSALDVDFDPVGMFFDNDMFVLGRTNPDAINSLWRVYTDGSCEEFMTGVSAFTFGDDGAMYVSQYNWGTQEVSISRVIPEPATLVLLAVGGVCLRRRKA